MSGTEARSRGLLSQKDLMVRWGVNSARTIQRLRKQFGLLPVDFYGINPLFSESEVQAMEERRRVAGMERLKRQSARGRGAAGILSLKQIRQRAGKRRAKK